MIAVDKRNDIVDAVIEAELHMKHENYRGALDLLEHVVASYPRYLPAKQILAQVFRKLGRSERGREIDREVELVSRQMAQEHLQRGSSQTRTPDPRRQLAESLDGIVKQIYVCGDLQEVLRISTMWLRETCDADRCLLIGLGQERAPNHESRRAGTLSAMDNKAAKLNFLILKKVTDSGLVVIDDPMESLAECGAVVQQLRIHRLIACPLLYQSQQTGFIVLHRGAQSECWSEFDKILLRSAAGHVAVAAKNTRKLAEIGPVSLIDKVTGLYTRYLFEEAISVELINAHQQGYPVSLALLDIGGIEEERVLHRISFLLKTTVRKGTMVARFSERRFAVILPNAGIEIACGVMNKIRSLAEKTIVDNSGVPITVNMGVSEATFGNWPYLSIIQQELFQRAGVNLAATIAQDRVCAHPSPGRETESCSITH